MFPRLVSAKSPGAGASDSIERSFGAENVDADGCCGSGNACWQRLIPRNHRIAADRIDRYSRYIDHCGRAGGRWYSAGRSDEQQNVACLDVLEFAAMRVEVSPPRIRHGIEVAAGMQLLVMVAVSAADCFKDLRQLAQAGNTPRRRRGCRPEGEQSAANPARSLT